MMMGNSSNNLNSSTGHACEADLIQADILSCPLLAKNNTFYNLFSKPPQIGNIYFGTGLATPKEISQGLPFDFLGMLLTAEWMRQKTNGKKIIHEISDSHACIVHDKKRITALANQQKEQATKLATSLGLGNIYSCVLASEYRHTTEFKDIQREIDKLSPTDTLPYVRYQSAGNLYFARYKNVSCKIGWLVDDNKTKGKLDERSFNAAYDALGLDPICFAYTWCGWTFDQQRSRVSPYTSIKGEKRIMLEGQSSAAFEIKKLLDQCSNKKISRLAIMHLARILTTYDNLFGESAPNFWCSTPKKESNRFIKVPKQEEWVSGEYIDVWKLSQQIDKIRSLQVNSYALHSKEHGLPCYDIEFKEQIAI